MASRSRRIEKAKRSNSKVFTRNKFILGLAGLAVLVVIAYQPVWHAGFIWDDDLHLTKNPCIVGPLGFKGIWTTAAATYYPLVLSNFWIQHAIWGLNALPYHLVNVAAQISCGILLWRVLRQLEVKGAWLGATLWALHPVQVESVAWITELKNTQSCFFYLLSIFFFLKWREPGIGQTKAWNYIAALLCALLSILSKSSTVMLPIVLGLCSWWKEGRWRWQNVLQLLPFFLISVLASAWTIWEQKFHSGAMGQSWRLTWLERGIIAGWDIWFYLGKLIWPHPLIFIYPRWEVKASLIMAYVPAFGAIAGLIILWWKRNGPLRPIFFAVLYFAISLFPVLGFFDVYFFRYSFVGDHLQYLASIGPLVLIGSGIVTLSFFVRERIQPLVQGIAGSVILFVFIALTWEQSTIYVDAETLWKATLSRDSNSWMARNNLGIIHVDDGHLNEALADFQQALEESPIKVEIWNNIADVYLRMGRINDAFPYLQKALEVEPERPDVLSNLGNALLRTGQIEQAIVPLQKALQKYPTHVPALNYIGTAFLLTGRVDESFVYLHKALELDPSNNSVRFNLVNTLLQMNRVDEALSCLHKALELSPDDVAAQKNLAWILATWPEDRIRNGVKAVELAERANELSKGRNPTIVVTLSAAYAETGRFSDAIAAAEAALQIAIASGNEALANGIRGYITLYQTGSPVRDIRSGTGSTERKN